MLSSFQIWPCRCVASWRRRALDKERIPLDCTIAVKSDGHIAFADVSTIQDGLTGDPKNLKTIRVSSHKKTTFVGSTIRWADVYLKLDPFDLAIMGGRSVDIGAGGLNLGDCS